MVAIDLDQEGASISSIPAGAIRVELQHPDG